MLTYAFFYWPNTDVVANPTEGKIVVTKISFLFHFIPLAL